MRFVMAILSGLCVQAGVYDLLRGDSVGMTSVLFGWAVICGLFAIKPEPK